MPTHLIAAVCKAVKKVVITWTKTAWFVCNSLKWKILKSWSEHECHRNGSFRWYFERVSWTLTLRGSCCPSLFGCWCDGPGLWTPHSLCDHISVYKTRISVWMSGDCWWSHQHWWKYWTHGCHHVAVKLLEKAKKNLTFFLDSEHQGNTKVDVVVCVFLLYINRRRCRCVITRLVFNGSDNQNYQTQSRRTVCLSGSYHRVFICER